ncbi:type II secretion system protein N [uncultured Paraglaciecola sp.]|uniref:type II secretion system protein N n=1 Tax=uncultured Paraglaciecola sp. TaxID=1765024 RepID=UPI00262CBF12|nr:type II secretion system protein N [uncultured Paraglaciecola sp.]
MTIDTNTPFRSLIYPLQQMKRHLHNIITLLLAFYLLNIILQCIRPITPTSLQEGMTQSTMPIAKPSQIRERTNIITIQQLHLFGLPEIDTHQANYQFKIAPETALNLTLTGVVASSENNNGAAIIENKGQQKTYGVNDKIDGTRAVIQQVLVDRIVIRNVNKTETLMFDGEGD